MLAHSILSLILYVVIQNVISIHPSLNHQARFIYKEQLCERQTTQIVHFNIYALPIVYAIESVAGNSWKLC